MVVLLVLARVRGYPVLNLDLGFAIMFAVGMEMDSRKCAGPGPGPGMNGLQRVGYCGLRLFGREKRHERN